MNETGPSTAQPGLITQRMLAEATGFNQATVSRALRNDPKITQAVRKAINAKAMAMGYKPDPLLAKIASTRYKTRHVAQGTRIAFITSKPRVKNAENINAMAMHRAHERASALGYGLESFYVNDYPHGGALSKVLLSRGIRGAIFYSVTKDDFFNDMPWDNFTAIVCNSYHYAPPVSLISMDYANAIKECTRQALARGYQRIGYVMFEGEDQLDDLHRLGACHYLGRNTGLHKAGSPLILLDPAKTAIERDADFIGLRQWLHEHQPDCVIGFNTSVWYWLEREGYFKRPVCGYQDMIASTVHPHTGCSFPYVKMMTTAIDMMDMLLRTWQQGLPETRLHILIDPEWSDTGSLPPVGG
ncbi:MAG: hypothetical protein SFY80_07555 [Verrucomicrobiota bacterium]|nr:hypothetical protein [Verrucomicrobiota bacterium]